MKQHYDKFRSLKDRTFDEPPVALTSAQASRQAIAKADAREAEFRAKIDQLQEALRAASAGLD
jgi:hypothetical protein